MQNGVLTVEVPSIQRSLATCALQYYTGTQNGVLTVEVPSIQRSLATCAQQYYTGTQNGVLTVEVPSIQEPYMSVQCTCMHEGGSPVH